MGFKADFTPWSWQPWAGESRPTAATRRRCCSQLLRLPGVWPEGWDRGTRKVTITLFLLVFFLTTFLFLFIYFVISLLLSIFLVLLGKTKHHLENALGKGEGGRDVQQKHASPPFLPKAQHQPTGAPGARLASCLPPHDTGSPGMKDQVCSNSRLQL